MKLTEDDRNYTEAETQLDQDLIREAKTSKNKHATINMTGEKTHEHADNEEEAPRERSDVNRELLEKTEDNLVERKEEKKEEEQETEVKNGQDEVDALADGVWKCNLGNTACKDSGDDDDDDASVDLAGQLSRLELTSGEDGQEVDMKQQVKSTDIKQGKQEPQEDDERQLVVEEKEQEEEDDDEQKVMSAQEKTKTVKLVKLEAAAAVEEKACEEGERSPLCARAPDGLPVYHSQTVDGVQQQHFGDHRWTVMPVNLSQTCNGTQNYQHQMGVKQKRVIDELEFHQEEAPKYFKQHNIVRQQMQQPRAEEMNNLNAPPGMLSKQCTPPLPSPSRKSIKNVSQRQMSGGTVYTATDVSGSSEPANFTGAPTFPTNFDFLDLFNFLESSGSGGGGGDCTSLDQFLEEVTSIATTSANTTSNPAGDVSQVSVPSAADAMAERNPQLSRAESSIVPSVGDQQHYHHYHQMLPGHLQNSGQAVPVTPHGPVYIQQKKGQQQPQEQFVPHFYPASNISNTTTTSNNNIIIINNTMQNSLPIQGQMQQQQQQHQHMAQNDQQQSFGGWNETFTTTTTNSNMNNTTKMTIAKGGSNSSFEDGYCSDFSPFQHDSQCPSTPSPQSSSDTSQSPVLPSGSSPRQNWSPSPQSVDSGMCSPMSVDSSGYPQQTTSPRNSQAMSPDCATQIPTASEYEAGQGGQFSNYIDSHLEDLLYAIEVVSDDLGNYPTLDGQSSFQQPPLLPAAVQVDQMNIPRTVPHTIASPTYNAPSQKSMGHLSFPLVVANAGTAPQAAVKKVAAAATAVSFTAAAAKTPRGKAANDVRMTTPPMAVAAVQAAPCPIIIATTTTTAMAPLTHPKINDKGKVAIPPLVSKASLPGPIAPVLPVVMTSNGQVGQVFVFQTQKASRYQPIAPKAPLQHTIALPAEDAAGATSSSTGNGSGFQSKVAQEGQGESTNTEQGNTRKKNGTKKCVDKLNAARRSVADWGRDDLVFIDPDGDTYLHVAVCRADHHLIQALMERLGRENLISMVDAQNHMGQTPLYLAVSENKLEMVRVFVESGADVTPFAEFTLDNGTREKSAAIHRTSSQGESYQDTLFALLSAPGIKVDQEDSEGHTALHCAILCHGKVDTNNQTINSIPIIKTLLQAGADPNHQVQTNGKTALMYALESRNLDLIESIFSMVETARLGIYLKTQAFDGNSCQKIADSLKSNLDVQAQLRLQKCLKPSFCRTNH